jgi:hypothetical protein
LARSVFGLLVGFLARAAFLAGLAFLAGVRFVFGRGTSAEGMFDYTYGHSLGLILVGFVALAPLVSGEKPQAAGVRSNTLALLDRAVGALLLVGSLPVLIPAALITRILSRRSPFIAHLRIGQGADGRTCARGNPGCAGGRSGASSRRTGFHRQHRATNGQFPPLQADGRGLDYREKAGQASTSYYRLANEWVAATLESIAALAPPHNQMDLRSRTRQESERIKELRFARSCYRHPGGGLAVEINRALLDRKFLVCQSEKSYGLTDSGQEW